jgi:O-antigen ligase
LSLAQVYHGFMLCVVSLYLICRLRRPCEKPLATVVCIVMFLLITGASTLMALRYNGHVQEDVIAFSQILYWVLAWLIYVIECSTPEGCRLALRGVLAGGVYMAISVVLLHVFGGDAYSRYEGVEASFGGFSTAKSLGGILCVAALLSLRIRSTPWQAGLLCVSLAGLMLTYQRAGQLAMVAAILWIAGTHVKTRVREVLLSGRSVVAFACILVVAAGFVDTDALAERWKDVDLSLGGKAGSGRLGLWTDAIRAFEDLNWLDRMLGIGYSGMRDAMLEEGLGGNRKHTHSDILDILLAFGILGMLGWIALHYAVIQTVRACPKSSAACAIAGAVYIVFLVESLMTGQVFGPATMIAYLGAITGLCGAAREPDAVVGSVGAGPCEYDYCLGGDFPR